MIIIVLFFWLILSPVQVIAQEDIPAPTATPSATLTPAAATATPVPPPASTPTPTSAPASSTSTNTPTPTTVTKPTVKQTTNSQSGGLGGGGLVEEKENNTGLGFDDEKVLGAADSKDVDSVGDKDLLVTLIFLTAAVVLIVWTVYVILVQKGVITSGVKKDLHKGGITPQPLQ